ncbi:MAG: glycosyltransferase family 39 protein [Candidatus Dormiibacterota bacterium]
MANPPIWLVAATVCVLGLVLALHQLNLRPLVDFDEALNAVIVDHMVRTGNWLVPVFDASTRLRRPPLYFWLSGLVVVLSHQHSAWAYRLPSALAGVFLATGLVIFLRRQLQWTAAFAGLAGICLLTMPYFLLLSRQAMLAALAAALATAAILAGRQWTRGRGGWWAPLVTSSALGLLILDYSAMVVLPLAVVALDAALRGRRPAWTWRQGTVVLALALALGLWWPLLMSFRFGGNFWGQYLFQNVIARVTSNVETGGRPIYDYPPLVAAGMGAWAPLAALAVVRSWNRIRHSADSLERLAAIWVVVGVVGFSLSTTKLPWYMGPVYPGLAILVVAYLRRLPGELGFTVARGQEAAGRGSAAMLGVAALAGIGLGVWPVPRPAWALLVCAAVGAAAIAVEIARARPGFRVNPSAGTGRLVACALAGLMLVALGRALIFPLGPGAPGFAENLQPEPAAASEAAIAKLAARDPAVPLALLVNSTPTLIFYSDRSQVATYTTVAAAAKARGSWLITETGQLAALRSDVSGARLLGQRGGLVLVALPGAPGPSHSKR